MLGQNYVNAGQYYFMIIENKFQIYHSQLTSMKISLLKEAVYPKKKTFTIRSQSFKIIPNKKDPIHSEQVPPSVSEKTEKNKISEEVLQQLSGRSIQSLKTTILEFNSKNPSINSNTVSWTVHNWIPRNFSLQKSTRSPLNEEPIQTQCARRSCFQRPELEGNKLRKVQQKDGQSLLRKNSLFLVNFIKTRERKSLNVAHIGNVPMILEKLDQKQQNPIKQYLTAGQKKPRYPKARKEDASQKHIRNPQNILYPQPW